MLGGGRVSGTGGIGSRSGLWGQCLGVTWGDDGGRVCNHREGTGVREVVEPQEESWDGS